MLNEQMYRELAGQYHVGQWSALYAFASTGTIQPSLASEIVECFELAKSLKDRRSLESFYATVGPAITADNVGAHREFWHRTLKSSDGSPVRCRANGKVKLWKTRPTEFQLPVKYGLRECFYINRFNAADWTFAP